MNNAAFAFMAAGYFTGNTLSEKLLFHKSLGDALWIGGLSTILWVVLFGGYLWFTHRSKS